jgi:guanosine-3',5'-bis(diphosphate) 3'-pyrophosphohydrolase
MPNLLTGRLLAAIHFAAQKHRDQRRKGAEQAPYINHPIEVAELLWRVGAVEEETPLLAAILHDTVEDTDTSPDEIEQRFGAQVRQVVMEVTDNKSLPKIRRKQLQVEHAPVISRHAKLVKLADKISNLRTMLESPPLGWNESRLAEYILWGQQVVAGLRGVNEGLEQEYDSLLARAKSTFSL